MPKRKSTALDAFTEPERPEFEKWLERALPPGEREATLTSLPELAHAPQVASGAKPERERGTERGALASEQDSSVDQLQVPGRESADVEEGRLSLLREAIGATLAVLGERLNALLASDYKTQHHELANIHSEYRALTAFIIESKFNEVVKLFPKQTLQEKQTFCKWVNSELSNLGLSVAAPESGRPASLAAGTGSDPTKGRFEFLYEREDGTAAKIRRADLPDYIRLVASHHLDRRPGRADVTDALEKVSGKR